MAPPHRLLLAHGQHHKGEHVLSSLWFQERRLDRLTNRDEPFMRINFFFFPFLSILITFFHETKWICVRQQAANDEPADPFALLPCWASPSRKGPDASWQAVDARSTM